MKLKLVLFATLFISASYASAATSTEDVSRYSTPSLGIQAGLDFSNAQTPAQISTNSYTGFSAGLNLDVPLTENFSLQPELNYVRHGLNLVDSGSVKANVYYNSFELPILAKVGFGEKVRPYLFAGPMATLNFSNSVQGSIGGTSASTSFNPNTIDLAGVVGVGVEVGPFFVNARYLLGFTNINSNSADWYSRGFRLMAGLQL